MGETVVAGLPIPSTSPIFLAGVAVHVALGLAAVTTGAVAMLSAKGPGRHPRQGATYVWALGGVALTAGGLAAARWAEDKALFGLAVLAFGLALAGRMARRQAAPGWVAQHIMAMGLSYVTLLTAFYVDNGPNLPIWRDLPPIAYWLGPGLVGGPLILLALARHPLARAARLAIRRPPARRNRRRPPAA